MDKFSTHTGIGVPLRRSNVDTDQIIPAVYLKRVTRSGFEDGLFAAWRKDETFVLNDPSYAAGSVLVAGPDFGTGSSREHAVWALMNYGFRAVISSRFAAIDSALQASGGELVTALRQKHAAPFVEDGVRGSTPMRSSSRPATTTGPSGWAKRSDTCWNSTGSSCCASE